MCIDLLDDTPKEDPIVTRAKEYVEANKRNFEDEGKRDTKVTFADEKDTEYGKININTFDNGKPKPSLGTFKVVPKWDSSYFRVFVNDILHLSFQHKKFTGIQTWMDGEKVIKYCIEISLENTPPILLEYDMPEKWKIIINELVKHQHLF